ncbi:collagenase-like protease [Methanolobus tindarius DSM 2278]|uniref:Collagenase-like protease n=1 Tax=Methanolobus tindarius DSM 2278 TaxID=1090322 RepID=W9DPT2_METTI|nr:peptidase U32 family protein [Methanolobus tindarius]ETA67313.1 collagenase-like protease [Methanolobus tindarius DSM 2278]
MSTELKEYKIPELIMGVRNFAALKACQQHADAVYFSLDKLSLRSRAQEITTEKLASFIDEIHTHGLKGYMAVNSVIYPDNLTELDEVLECAASAEVDAVIAWDPATITKAAEKDLRIHISTQANVSNQVTAEFYRSLGASRVVLARELSLEQIAELKKDTKMELEAFVHGAMCQAISGRCYLSAYLLGKSGNCGECSQPCRWEWSLHSDNGAIVDIEGKYLMSAKDLCMIEYIPELVKAGIDSFKVEGRLRNPGYTATVSESYRKAIDLFKEGNFTRDKVLPLKEKMALEYNRGFSTGFYFGYPGPDGLAFDFDMNASPVKREAVGIVTNYYPKQSAAAVKLLEQGLEYGETIVIEGSTTYLEQEVTSIVLEGKNVDSVERGNEIGLAVEDIVRKNDRLFKVRK